MHLSPFYGAISGEPVLSLLYHCRGGNFCHRFLAMTESEHFRRVSWFTPVVRAITPYPPPPPRYESVCGPASHIGRYTAGSQGMQCAIPPYQQHRAAANLGHIETALASRSQEPDVSNDRRPTPRATCRTGADGPTPVLRYS